MLHVLGIILCVSVLPRKLSRLSENWSVRGHAHTPRYEFTYHDRKVHPPVYSECSGHWTETTNEVVENEVAS